MVANEITLEDVIAARDPACQMGHRVTPVARDRAHVVPRIAADRDRELAEAIRLALNSTDCGRLRHVAVCAYGGHVWLSGSVDTYYAKQLAQTAALSIDGVAHLHNDVEVE